MGKEGTYINIEKRFFRLTLVISVLVGIILPVLLTGRPVDWDWFFLIMAIGLSFVWFLYAVILLIIVFHVRLGPKIKASHRNGVTVIRYELLNPGKKK